MKFDFIPEPELEFGAEGKHVDIRFGIMDYGPADAGLDRAPDQIVVGLIGTPVNIEGAREWLNRCREEINAKESRQPNLFPRFPGFRLDTAFRSTLVLDSGLEREIPARDIEKIVSGKEHNRIVADAVDRFCAEMRLLKEKRPPHVFLCAVPPEIERLRDPAARVGGAPAAEGVYDFRRLLKARAMDLSSDTKFYAVGGHEDLRSHLVRNSRFFRGQRARRSRARCPLKKSLKFP